MVLCEEDYHWQWNSIKSGACPACLLFLLAIIVQFFIARGSHSLLAQLLSMLLICGTIGLIGASVAFFASYKFNRYLYGKLQKNLD